jgi:hypothetical protein
MFPPSMPAIRADYACILTLAPAGCLKIWLLTANICAWLVIIMTIYGKIF